MEAAHHKALSQVIEVLSHGNDIVSFSSGAVVNHASLHPRAETTDRVFLHTIFGSFDYGIRLEEVGDVETLHVGNERLRLVFVHHGVHSHTSYFKLDWCHRLEVLENVYHG